MSDSGTVETLLRDLLEWTSRKERTYAEVMDVWRTCCPRFPIWEEASDRGLVATSVCDGHRMVKVTADGLALLERVRTDLPLD
jgi:D-3-phosphoglycerate dehydrogenase